MVPEAISPLSLCNAISKASRSSTSAREIAAPRIAPQPAELSAMMLGARANHTYEYDTEGASTMLINLAFMIDIATCECSVPSDLEE